MQLTKKFLLLTTLSASAIASLGKIDVSQQPLSSANQCLCPCDGSDGQSNGNAVQAILDGIIGGGPIRYPNIDGSQHVTIDQAAWTLRPNTGFYMWLNWFSASTGSQITTTGQRVCLDEGELRWLITMIVNSASGGAGGGIHGGSGGGIHQATGGIQFGAGQVSGQWGSSHISGGQTWGQSGGGGQQGQQQGGGQQQQQGGGQQQGGQQQQQGGGQQQGGQQGGGQQHGGQQGGGQQQGGQQGGGQSGGQTWGSSGGQTWGQGDVPQGTGVQWGAGGGGSNDGDSSTSLGNGACFKIKDVRTGKFWGTYGPEYAISNSPSVFSVFKAHPTQGGWTFDEVRRQGASIGKAVHIAGKNQISGNQRGTEAVFTLSNANFGKTCLGLRDHKVERRSDWTGWGWGDNYRAASSGQNCADVELVENAC